MCDKNCARQQPKDRPRHFHSVMLTHDLPTAELTLGHIEEFVNKAFDAGFDSTTKIITHYGMFYVSEDLE
jgi:hypothetical protein